MFKIIKLINYFLLTGSIVIAFVWGFVAFFTYCIGSALLLICISIKGKKISEYIMENYPDIYQRRKMNYRFTMRMNAAINMLALTQSEIENFSDKKIAAYISGVADFFKNTIISLIIIVIASAYHYYSKR